MAAEAAQEEPAASPEPESPKVEFVVAEPVPLPPVFDVPVISSDDEDSEKLTEEEKERRAKLKRMEERRIQKREEEALVESYVEESKEPVAEAAGEKTEVYTAPKEEVETKEPSKEAESAPEPKAIAEEPQSASDAAVKEAEPVAEVQGSASKEASDAESASKEQDENSPSSQAPKEGKEQEANVSREVVAEVPAADADEDEAPAVRMVLPSEASLAASEKQAPSTARAAPSTPAPTTMRAVVREGLTGLTMAFRTGVAISLKAPLEQRLVVRVLAAGINPVDYKIPKLVGGPVVGLDFCGEVASVRPDTTPFKLGDLVYGNAQGCLAEYVVCDVDKINFKPRSLSPVEAAALPTAYLTALQGLKKYLTPGKNVLVIGASGGCGIAALQIARSMGAAEIVGVCSAKNIELVREHGATRVIDYNVDKVSTVHQKWQTPQQFFDVVFDAATGSGGKENYYEESQKVLKPNGKIVCLNGGVSTWLRKFTNFQRADQDLILTAHSAKDLAELTAMIDSTEEKRSGFRPVIAKVFPFDEQNVKSAFDLLKSRRTVGKIVLQMREPNNTTPTSTSTSTTTNNNNNKSAAADDNVNVATSSNDANVDESGSKRCVQQADPSTESKE